MTFAMRLALDAPVKKRLTAFAFHFGWVSKQLSDAELKLEQRATDAIKAEDKQRAQQPLSKDASLTEILAETMRRKLAGEPIKREADAARNEDGAYVENLVELMAKHLNSDALAGQAASCSPFAIVHSLVCLPDNESVADCRLAAAGRERA